MLACTEHSLLPPRDALSRLSSSPGAANIDVRRPGWRFSGCPLSPRFPDPSAQHLPGRSVRSSPHGIWECPPCRASLSSHPVNPAFSGHCCWSLTHCGLHGIGKTFGRHQRPTSILKTILKAQFSSQ